MIVRLLVAGFVSLVSGVCYLAGMLRLMSGLLILFGFLAALAFGIHVVLPPQEDAAGQAYHGFGSAWPFFLVAVILGLVVAWLFFHKPTAAEPEELSGYHLKLFVGGTVTYLLSLFLPAFLWFPSERRLTSIDSESLALQILLGVVLYLIGILVALLLLYRASKGVSLDHRDLMRRFVLAFFAVFHLDKMPALIAYLLVFSPESQVVFPKIAALALGGYILVSVFLVKLSHDAQAVP